MSLSIPHWRSTIYWINLLAWGLSLPDTLSWELAVAILLLYCLVTAKGDRKLRLGDFAALSFVVLLLLVEPYSVARQNHRDFTMQFACALCIYWSVCLADSTAELLKRIVYAGSIVALLVASSDIYLFYSRLADAGIFGPSAIASLRASFTLLGGTTRNDGAMLLLALLPFPCGAMVLAEKSGYSWRHWTVMIALMVVLAALLITFSRGIYFAVAVFAMAASCVLLWRADRGFRGIWLQVLAGCLLLGFCASQLGLAGGIRQTAKGDATTSERRSLTGRLNIWNQRIQLIRERPLMGYGGDTGGFMSLKTLSHNYAMPFTARAYNAPVELALAAGCIGLVIYSVFLLIPIVGTLVFSRPDDVPPETIIVAQILALGLLALVMRDLTYSSLILDSRTIALAWLSVALLNNIRCPILSGANQATNSLRTRGRELARINPFSVRTCGWLVLCIVILCVVRSYQESKAATAHNIARRSLIDQNVSESLAALEQAIEYEPSQAVFHADRGLLLASQAIDFGLDLHPWTSLPILSNYERELLWRANSEYQIATSFSEKDATFWSNRGWILALLGDEERALQCFESAVRRDPGDVMSQISLGLYYERHGLTDQARVAYGTAIASSPRIVDSAFFSDLKARNTLLGAESVDDALHRWKDSPASPIRLASEGKLYSYLGDNARAFRSYTAAVGELPNLSYAWANRAELDIINGDRKEAQRDAERALFLDGANTVALGTLAQIEDSEGNSEVAKARYIRAAEIALLSVHASRSWRVYHVAPLAGDDIVPGVLLPYVSGRLPVLPHCGEWLQAMEDVPVNWMGIEYKRRFQAQACSMATKDERDAK